MPPFAINKNPKSYGDEAVEMIYLLVGLGVGILLGALLQERVVRGEPKQSEIAQLLKDAATMLGTDETVSITVVAGRENDDSEGGSAPDVRLPKLENWRNN